MGKYFLLGAITLLVITGLWFALKPPPAAPAQEEVQNGPEVGNAVYINASSDVIRIETPQSGARVGPTFNVSGAARGNWYFEASFPLEVLDSSGKQLVITPVQAGGDWMTTEFVPFSISVTVPGYTGSGTLVLHRDNPSGLPEHDASVAIPITIQ